MGNQMDIALPDGTKVPGGHPFILVGPNGAGKTRLGATIARLNQGDRIPALRNLQVEVNIPMGMADRMKTEVDIRDVPSEPRAVSRHPQCYGTQTSEPNH